MKKSRGFTLIELLVVVAIIGMLSSMVLVSVNSSRIKSRDARRLSDLSQIQKALELFYSQNGRYPQINSAATFSAATLWNGTTGSLQYELRDFISRLPVDPTNDTSYQYWYDSDSANQYQSYGLMTRLEYSGNYSKASSDGGTHQGTVGNYYEIGEQPSFCARAGKGDWYLGGAAQVCQNP